MRPAWPTWGTTSSGSTSTPSGSPASLRGADADEVHLRLSHLAHVGAEPQSSGGQGAREELLEARLLERGSTRSEAGDPPGVDVDPDDVVPQVGHAGRVHRAEVAAADHREPHAGQASQAQGACRGTAPRRARLTPPAGGAS